VSELEQIQNILKAHKNLNFVDRILNPQDYPSLERPDLGPGAYSTHLMSYDWHPNGGFMVYPEVVFDQRSGKLKRFSRASAKSHALATGDFIPFTDEAEASWFSEAYKKVWKK
jgi:hypothetical protein